MDQSERSSASAKTIPAGCRRCYVGAGQLPYSNPYQTAPMGASPERLLLRFPRLSNHPVFLQLSTPAWAFQQAQHFHQQQQQQQQQTAPSVLANQCKEIEPNN
ncbi:hypothetical protein SDJN03_17398, partial [Cucurbita argyrosperma subsp. sororia]